MKRITQNLALLTIPRIANIWLLTDPQGRRFLIDTGHMLEQPLLRLSLWQAGVRSRGDLAAVLLTHRHSDHAGNAAWLKKTFDCPVICHAFDAPFLKGLQKAPKMALGQAPFYQEVLCYFEDYWPARCPIDEVFDQQGQWRWGFHVFPAFGHTQGSVLLYHEPTKVLFSGDAILSGVPPFRLIEKLRFAVPGFSYDVQQCRENVCQFLKSSPKTEALCSGHGPVVLEAHEKLQLLVRCL